MAVKISKITILPENIKHSSEFLNNNQYNKFIEYEFKLAKEHKLEAFTFEFLEEKKQIIKNYFFSDCKQALLFYTSILNNFEYVESHLSDIQSQKNAKFIVNWSIDFDCVIEQNHN